MAGGGRRLCLTLPEVGLSTPTVADVTIPGGAFRQAGIVAAAALYALDYHLDDLADDHARARRLAEGVGAAPGLTLPLGLPETNIVFVEVSGGALDPANLRRRLSDHGVLAGWESRHRLRLVVHRDLEDADISRAVEAFRVY